MDQKFIVAIEEHKKDLLDKQEWELYFFIEALGGFVWTPSHLPESQGTTMARHAFGEKNEYYRALQDANIQKLSSFGVDPKSAHDLVNGEYWKWYAFWQQWHESLTKDQLLQLHDNAKHGLSVEEFLPQMQWNTRNCISA
jgi:hypothetical protein